MRRFYKFHLHGDNIVECERTVDLIRRAFADITLYFRGPFGSPVCPTYELLLKDAIEPITLTLYPGFGRWNHDILNLIRLRGGTLREAADIIITGVADNDETPLIAIEYCGALPAGNQAWQRSGRAYSFGKAEVLYLYVAELGGYELGADRVRKAARLPNPAVPFSFVSFSLMNKTPTLPVFVPSPGAHNASRTAYAGVFAEEELLALIRSVILAERNEVSIEALRFKALSFVETKAAASRAGETLTPAQWKAAYVALENHQSLVDFLVSQAPLRWTKTAYIDGITTTARELMNKAALLAIGMTSSKLPMCIVPREKRAALASEIERMCEGRIQADFLDWLRKPRHLSICWVMGFKPRGDDARPDRGLPPLTRMLIGKDEDLLTVVYGPASSSTWERLHNAPRKLLANGLWEAILDASDALLVDSSTDGIRHHGYLRSHWHEERAKPELEMVFVQPKPLYIGENDVDTVLHLLLARHGGSFIFEGMCNPPGGDWSGISLKSVDNITELRWLTLPRVSSVGAKRPDHVFQFFVTKGRPIILCVESKETAASVESNIGPRLVSYIETLLQTPASIERTDSTTQWTHSVIELNAHLFDMASAVAFITDSEDKITSVKERANADLLMCFSFLNAGDICRLRLIPTTSLGARIADIIVALPLEGNSISVAVDAV
jgi:hypothetical protein